MRRGIFTFNVDRIRDGQLLFDRGLRSYDLRINCLGDLTFEEFGSRYTGFGVLGGDNTAIDGIEPVSERIFPETHRNYVQQASSLDWSLTGDLH